MTESLRRTGRQPATHPKLVAVAGMPPARQAEVFWRTPGSPTWGLAAARRVVGVVDDPVLGASG